MKPLKILLIEDSADYELQVARILSRSGFEVLLRRVETEEAMRDTLAQQPWDIIISDYVLRSFSCEGALDLLKGSGKDIPFIVLASALGEETILRLLRAGVRDHVMKENLTLLPSSVERELRDTEDRLQRKRLEAHLQQAMKMEAIGRLAGGVAHDFNNLLTVITGFAQLALLDEKPSREGLEQIIRAAERASGLTRQLLAFSRQQALEPRVFDLNWMVRDMEKMLSRLIGEDVEVLTRIDREPLRVKADPSKMEQVILNLAVNARDAMPGGGKLILSTSRRTLTDAVAALHGVQDGEYCAISVSDNGMGMDPDVLSHIFEPFFTTKPEGQGTGLGLATVYGIAQQSGGAVHAYSEKGIGTTMTVFIPATESAMDAASGVEPPLDEGVERVLVAEDDAGVRKLICKTLAARGFQVTEASSGEAALLILREKGPGSIDVLVTDVVLPAMSGPALAALASELQPRVRILFMSGYTEDVINHHGMMTSGSAAFLQKPFAPRDLLRKVRQLLDAVVI